MKQAAQILPIRTDAEVKKIVGRPKKYTKEFIEKLALDMLEWFGLNLNGKTNQQAFENNGNLLLKKFAVLNGFTYQRISEFAHKNDYFAQVLELCKETQYVKIADAITNAKGNPAGVIFLGKQFGMRDREPGETGLNQDEIQSLKTQAKQVIKGNS